MKNIGKTLAECVRPASDEVFLVDTRHPQYPANAARRVTAAPSLPEHFLLAGAINAAAKPIIPATCTKADILALCDSIEANQRAIDETVAAMRKLCE